MKKQTFKLSATIVLFVLVASICAVSGCSPDPIVVYAKQIEEINATEVFSNAEKEILDLDDYFNQLFEQDPDTITVEEILAAKERVRAFENEIAEIKAMVERIDIEDEKVQEINSYLFGSFHNLSLLFGELQTILDIIIELIELTAEAKDPDSGLKMAAFSLRVEAIENQLNECLANGDWYVAQSSELINKWETALNEALGQ